MGFHLTDQCIGVGLLEAPAQIRQDEGRQGHQAADGDGPAHLLGDLVCYVMQAAGTDQQRFCRVEEAPPPGVRDKPWACWRTKSSTPNSASNWETAAEIEGGDMLIRSDAAAMLPASPTATKYSSCRKVNLIATRTLAQTLIHVAL